MTPRDPTPPDHPADADDEPTTQFYLTRYRLFVLAMMIGLLVLAMLR